MRVTTGLYISPDGVADRQLLIYCLTRVLGLHIPGVRYSCTELP